MKSLSTKICVSKPFYQSYKLRIEIKTVYLKSIHKIINFCIGAKTTFQSEGHIQVAGEATWRKREKEAAG